MASVTAASLRRGYDNFDASRPTRVGRPDPCHHVRMPGRPSRTRGRHRGAPLVLVATLLLLLSGCLRLDADLTVNPDDTVTGRYVVAYAKDPNRPEGGFVPVRELLVSRGTAKARKYDDGQYQGIEYELVGVPFADLAAFAAVDVQGRRTGTLRLVRDGDDVVVDGTFDFRETRSARRTPQQQAEAERLFQVRVRLTFPGAVQTANGRVEGRMVTWDVPPFVRTTLQARAGARPPAPLGAAAEEAGPPLPLPVLAAAAAGLGGLVLLLGLVLLVRRRRRRLSPGAVPGPADPAVFSWVLADRAAPRSAGQGNGSPAPPRPAGPRGDGSPASPRPAGPRGNGSPAPPHLPGPRSAAHGAAGTRVPDPGPVAPGGAAAGAGGPFRAGPAAGPPGLSGLEPGRESPARS
jgi:hypothetical protein